MSIYQLTEEHQLFRNSVQKWCQQQLVPKIEEMEEERKADVSLLTSMQDLGFLQAVLEEQFGGIEGDLAMNVILLDELGKAGASGFAQIVKQHAGMGLPILQLFKETRPLLQEIVEKGQLVTYVSQKESELPPIVNGLSAKYCIVHKASNRTLAIYDFKKEQNKEAIEYLGWWTGNIAKVTFKQQPLIVLSISEEMDAKIRSMSQALDAAILSGVMYTAMQQTVKYSIERTQFDAPLAQFQVIRHYLADMAIENEKIKQLLYRVAFTNDLKEFVVNAQMLRLNVDRKLPKLIEMAQQVHGGNGFMMEFPIQRLWRDSEMNKIMSQASYEDEETIGKQLFYSKNRSVV